MKPFQKLVLSFRMWCKIQKTEYYRNKASIDSSRHTKRCKNLFINQSFQRGQGIFQIIGTLHFYRAFF